MDPAYFVLPWLLMYTSMTPALEAFHFLICHNCLWIYIFVLNDKKSLGWNVTLVFIPQYGTVKNIGHLTKISNPALVTCVHIRKHLLLGLYYLSPLTQLSFLFSPLSFITYTGPTVFWNRRERKAHSLGKNCWCWGIWVALETILRNGGFWEPYTLQQKQHKPWKMSVLISPFKYKNQEPGSH